MHIRSLTAVLVVATLATSALAVDPEEFTTFTSDEIEIFGDVYLSEDGKSAPLILLFHQGNSSGRAEYADYIAPRLADYGYNIILIDQRLGGKYRWTGDNRTVRNMEPTEGKKTARSFCESFPDLVAALDYAIEQGFDGPRFAWGEAYSGALVFRLAGERPDDIDGVLSFSPALHDGRGGCDATQFLTQVRVPTFIHLPWFEYNNGKWDAMIKYAENREFPVASHQKGGKRTSRTLNPKHSSQGYEEIWQQVRNFLKESAAAASDEGDSGAE